MKLADYTVTEAGFAADLGAEKFLDIKCRAGGFHPDAVVIVATVRALKYHGGVPKAELNSENLEALEKGLPNLLQHVDNVKNVYGLPCVVAINAFPTDTKAELDLVEAKCKEQGVNVRLSEVWAKGGEGGKALAEEVIRLAEDTTNDHFQFVYDLEDSIEEKLNKIATKVYRADGVVLAGDAKKQVAQLTELGFDKMPICVAKTQFSFSDDQTKLGRSPRLQDHRPRDQGQRRCRLPGCQDRQHHDHAGSSQGSRFRAHRYRRQRQDHRPVLRNGCLTDFTLLIPKEEAEASASS